jgi:PAS domain S-box-containing protein
MTERVVMPPPVESAASWLRAIIESADDAIVTKSLEGIITSWNEGAMRIFGYTAEEVIGKPVSILIPPDHLDEEPNILAKLRRGERIDHYETVRVRKDGTLVDISLTVSPIRGADGRIVGASKIARDISRRKRDEVQLREQTEVIETVNRIGQMLAGELDLHKLVQAVTDAATEISGAHFGSFFYNVLDNHGASYMLYTLSGVPRSAFAHFPMPRATDLFGPTFRGEGTIRIDDVHLDPRYGKNSPYYGMPEGHLPVSSYLAVPVISRSGEVVGGLFFGHPDAGVFTDRAARIIEGLAAQAAIAVDNASLYDAAQRARAEAEQAARDKERLYVEAQESNRLKDEFLATVSHELRTPLTAILGWAHLLRTGQSDEENAARALETIERNARAQAQLIDDLLDVSRIITGKLRIDVRPIDPNSFIESAVEALRPAAEAKGVRVQRIMDTGVVTVSVIQ